ncbi:MAG TPA: TlpA disulfide reductase family protein [Polyangiaceae bacterium]|jgi:thiol-disulfide isomerase/thioredoxin
MAEREFYSGKVLYPTVVALVSLTALFAFAIMPRFFSKNPLVGREAPDFSLAVVASGSEGDRIHLSELKGHPVVLDFWATWCEPCQLAAPVLDRLSRKNHDKGLVVVGVNTSDQPGRAPVFAKRRGLSYPIVYDSDEEVARLYGVSNLPTLIVINAEGHIVAVETGYAGESSLEDLVNQAL